MPSDFAGVAGIDDAKICELKNQIASQHQVLQELLPQADAITSHLMAEAGEPIS